MIKFSDKICYQSVAIRIWRLGNFVLILLLESYHSHIFFFFFFCFFSQSSVAWTVHTYSRIWIYHEWGEKGDRRRERDATTDAWNKAFYLYKRTRGPRIPRRESESSCEPVSLALTDRPNRPPCISFPRTVISNVTQSLFTDRANCSSLLATRRHPHLFSIHPHSYPHHARYLVLHHISPHLATFHRVIRRTVVSTLPDFEWQFRSTKWKVKKKEKNESSDESAWKPVIWNKASKERARD